MEEFFEGFLWHSSIGIDNEVAGHKKFYTRLPNSKKARGMFFAASENMLIHKTTQALWRISDDGKSIEPVFSSDILSEEDVSDLSEE